VSRGRRRAVGVLLSTFAAALVAALLASTLVPPPGTVAGWRGPVGWLEWASGEDVGWPSEPAAVSVGSGRVDVAASGGKRPAAPVQVAIPAAEVDAEIQPIGLGPEGMEVPEPSSIGWFDAGPRPGEVGRTVMAGHVDTEDGAGVFARVPTLEPGALVAVTDESGAVHRYRVTERRQMPKERFPAESVYGSSVAPELVLITCGGAFDEGEDTYRDSIVVYARAL